MKVNLFKVYIRVYIKYYLFGFFFKQLALYLSTVGTLLVVQAIALPPPTLYTNERLPKSTDFRPLLDAQATAMVRDVARRADAAVVPEGPFDKRINSLPSAAQSENIELDNGDRVARSSETNDIEANADDWADGDDLEKSSSFGIGLYGGYPYGGGYPGYGGWGGYGGGWGGGWGGAWGGAGWGGGWGGYGGWGGGWGGPYFG